jgi:ABC-type Fe3+-hydroxamate transport system substrate-binding protein
LGGEKLKNITTLFAAVLITLILTASAYGTYSLYLSTIPSPTPTPTEKPTPTASPTDTPTPTATPNATATPTATPNATASPTPTPTPAPTNVTVTDGAGNTLTIQLPVRTIAALDGGVAEILCALGVQNLIIARCDSCTMPPSLLSVPSMGANDYAPNVEALIALKPDVIFASSMLPYNPTSYQQLKNAGIPVYIVDTTNPEPVNPSQMTKVQLYNSPTPIDFTCGLMQNFTKIVGHQSNATAYINWAQNYNKLVKDRIYSLTSDQLVKVFIEWYDYPYQTFVTQGIYQAGGINIAENQTVYSPVLTPEFVVQQNPSVIIEYISSPTHNINDFIAARNAILNRLATQNTSAVQLERVYAIDWSARSGIHAVIGYLYWAKWIQPSLFSDINPASINQDLNQKFFGTTIAGTFGYPEGPV